VLYFVISSAPLRTEKCGETSATRAHRAWGESRVYLAADRTLDSACPTRGGPLPGVRGGMPLTEQDRCWRASCMGQPVQRLR